MPIVKILLRTNEAGIEYGNHWEYFKTIYWKDINRFEETIIFFANYFFSPNFEKTKVPNMTIETKEEIINVRKYIITY